MNKLKKLRKEKGISQETMAHQLGYKNKSGYCQLENGTVKMTIDKAKKIADILGLKVEEIFFDDKVQETKTNINGLNSITI